MSNAELQAMLAEKAKELFDICDVEQKGFIIKRDMQRLSGVLPLDPDQIESVFDTLDDDGNGYLTLEEFTGGFGAFMGFPSGGAEASPGAAAACASPSASSASHFGGSASGRKRNRPSSPGEGAAASNVAPGQLSDCKTALRQAYKDIKGNGPHLFDFSLPFTDPANHRVSEQIIATAQRQMSHIRLSNDTWWNCVKDDLYSQTKNALYRHKIRTRHLRSRQKAK